VCQCCGTKKSNKVQSIVVTEQKQSTTVPLIDAIQLSKSNWKSNLVDCETGNRRIADGWGVRRWDT